jgi:hypothetical protein
MGLSKHFRSDITQVLVTLTVTAAALWRGQQASAADDFDIYPISDIDFGSWDDAGSLSTTTLDCIESWDNKRQKDYRLTLTNVLGGADFYLYLDGDSSESGDNRILITVSHRDIEDDPSNYEQLVEGVEGDKKKGQENNCPDVNSELTIDIDSSELNGKTSGFYSGTFELSGVGGKGYSESDSETFDITITIATSQAMVQISRVDDINVMGSSTLSGFSIDESFCVYSSETTYQLTVSSINQDSAGNFSLAGPQAEEFPLEIFFEDIANSSGQISVTNLPVTGSGDNQSASCSGVDNAKLTINFNEATLQAASPGVYTSSITLLVTPL